MLIALNLFRSVLLRPTERATLVSPPSRTGAIDGQTDPAAIIKVEEGIGLTARQRDAERLEVPRVFELERVVSCRSADPWWRTKLNFGSGESFDDLHRSTAFRLEANAIIDG